MSADVSRFWALREQSAHLRNPDRRDGPSREEAERAAAALDREADELSEKLYFQHMPTP